jgi:hypothetical protein
MEDIKKIFEEYKVVDAEENRLSKIILDWATNTYVSRINDSKTVEELDALSKDIKEIIPDKFVVFIMESQVKQKKNKITIDTILEK